MDLINRCKAGDEVAFAELFHRYKNLVYKTAYLILDDIAESEDVLQEVFVRLFRSLSTYQPDKASFTTWLHRITVNQCLNRRRTSNVNPMPWTSIPSYSQDTQIPSIEDKLDCTEAIRVAMTGLSHKLKAVVILRYYWELSYAEIADCLEIPVGTVRSRLNMAIKSLQNTNSAGTAGQRNPGITGAGSLDL